MKTSQCHSSDLNPPIVTTMFKVKFMALALLDLPAGPLYRCLCHPTSKLAVPVASGTALCVSKDNLPPILLGLHCALSCMEPL